MKSTQTDSNNNQKTNTTSSGMIGKLVGGALLALGVSYFVTKSQSKKTAVSDSETDSLQELLLFVNDRIAGYKRAVDESKDAELTGYYKQLVSQSQQFANQLNQHLRQLGGGRETGTTLKGKLYRRWMDAKATVTGFDEKAILASNVYGEEWAIKAYKDALDSQSLTGQLRQEVERQYEKSQQAYDKLQKLQSKHSA
ncbi:PA2169 family four-helix-bundle protein [Hymenobacter sp. ISL-91]|uniref:ferritin-like domain-containing protein n=1 Tax=Hymenobacter sp. ISL-91 TaxID=2819151 RepID=UPI001BE98E10|nr:PA2169 family four-helix-bundle protein [Hymenobacter sp. ISL-91]MBT2556415.1 PA2169 family four-helix-bundle protein [Hymenobacter sp. ISL-91]